VAVAACPSEFTYLPAVNGCYKLVLNNLPWDIAGLRCRALHPQAHLVVIGNESEHNAIAEWLRSHAGDTFTACLSA